MVPWRTLKFKSQLFEFVDPPPPCLKNHPGKSKETVGSLWQTIVQVVQLLNPQVISSSSTCWKGLLSLLNARSA